MGIKGYSAKSLPSRLYKWFWFEKRMPDGLCPYAWKSLFMYLVLIPYIVICSPIVLIDLFSKEKNPMADDHADRFLGSMVMYFGLLAILSLISAPSLLWITYEKNSFLGMLQFSGFALWAAAILVGIIILIKELYRVIVSKIFDMRFPNNDEPDKPSLVVEFVKAKYNKYCPKIDWEHQDELEDEYNG